MCKTIIEYTCKHREYEMKQCQPYIYAVRRAQREQGFWKTLLCPAIPICCPAPTQRRIFYTRCEGCEEKFLHEELARRQAAHRAKRYGEKMRRNQEVAEKAGREKPRATERISGGRCKQIYRSEGEEQILREKTIEEHERTAEQERVAEQKSLKQMKLAFLCSACRAEGRHSESRQREANGWLCCARGMDEFEARKTPGYANPTAVPTPQPLYYLDSQVYKPPTDKSSVAGPSRATSTAAAPKDDEMIRADARAAAHKYGWDYHSRESTSLEPTLVREYVNTSGINAAVLLRSVRAPAPATSVYEQLHLNEKQWASATQTKHGRLPPEPDAPLPIHPLSVPVVQGKVSRRRLAPQPLAIPARNAPGRGGSCDEEVSPLSSVPWRSADSMILELNRSLDEEMRSWREFVSPVEARRPFDPK